MGSPRIYVFTDHDGSVLCGGSSLSTGKTHCVIHLGSTCSQIMMVPCFVGVRCFPKGRLTVWVHLRYSSLQVVMGLCRVGFVTTGYLRWRLTLLVHHTCVCSQIIIGLCSVVLVTSLPT